MHIRKTFKGMRSIGLAPILENMEFVRCHFEGCVLTTDRDATQRAVARKIVLKDTRVTGCILHGVICKDCSVENLVSNKLIIVNGCAFEHVVLKGRISRLWIRGLFPVIDPASPNMDYSMVNVFEAANTAFYETIDWALDIREVVTQELQIDGIPAHLIRRDPERHVVFRRAKAVEGRWEEHDLRKTAGGLAPFLRNLAQSGPDTRVFVIPDVDPMRERALAAVAELRAAGIAEAD